MELDQLHVTARIIIHHTCGPHIPYLTHLGQCYHRLGIVFLPRGVHERTFSPMFTLELQEGWLISIFPFACAVFVVTVLKSIKLTAVAVTTAFTPFPRVADLI